MKRLRVTARVVAVMLLAVGSMEGQGAWQPGDGAKQMELWPGKVPDARMNPAPETVKRDEKNLVAGRSWLYIENVARPTLTFYPAQGRNTGATVLVFPGGGYEILAIDLEGTEVCDWLVSQGVNCVVVKYRVPAPRSRPDWGAYPQSPIALEDAQRAISLVRHHAREWQIDPRKIGVMGFSAGGHLVAAVSVHWGQRLYAAVDEADKESCRPDFAVAIYPGHLTRGEGTMKLNPDIASHISKKTPPTFLLQNEDDKVDSIWDALSYYGALIRAGVPVEFHSYAEGGHAFGLRRSKKAVTGWPDLVERWLKTIGMIGER